MKIVSPFLLVIFIPTTIPTRLETSWAYTMLPHVVKVVEVRPPVECSSQDLINELVRRVLQTQDIEVLRRGVASSWLSIDNIGKK